VEIHDTIFLTNSVIATVSLSTHQESIQSFGPISGGGHPTLRNAAVPPLLVLVQEEAVAPQAVTASVGSTVVIVPR
jgi:hypothetical protein